ncbi:MAG: thiamine pyrophosphate-dependent dehydrogenase E1 component subunit alpha [Gemmataceae bacterium]|nr:thiamine pyrophosphate-dependent dehydrogenase E1 component subunit alpha [Gemmataceae bacterium]
MVRSRHIDERMIKMSKSGEAFFWIGGPGEEAFNSCLGLQVKRGKGPEFDYLHLHYRSLATMQAMGLEPAASLRQMLMKRTDRNSMGRNFPGHYAIPEWNVVPVTSVIEVQFAMAPGTALMQKRLSQDAISIVVGGDAGIAEGDFTSCMTWSTRPGLRLPVLMIVTNNGYGISTPHETQHSEKNIIDRGIPFGIPGEVVDGNDVVESWHGIQKAMEYCRTERAPYLLEAQVSRLHGHSSSSGAARVEGEKDCLEILEKHLMAQGLAAREYIEAIHDSAQQEMQEAARKVLAEPNPTAADVPTHTYAPSPVDAVYPVDFDGLPGKGPKGQRDKGGSHGVPGSSSSPGTSLWGR